MSSELQNVANQVNFNWNKINTNMKNVASKTVSETLIPEQKEVHDRINLINESLITLSTKLQDLMEAHLDSSLEDEHSQSLSRKKQNHFQKNSKPIYGDVSMASDASDFSLGSDSTNSRFTTLFAEKSSTKLQTVGLSSKPASHPKNSDEDRQSQLERDMTALRAMNDVHTIMFCSL